MGNDMMNMVMIGGLLLVGGYILMNPGLVSNLIPPVAAAPSEVMEDAGVICQDEAGTVIGCPDDLGTDGYEWSEDDEDIDEWKTCPSDWKKECKAAGKRYTPERKCKAKAIKDPNNPDLEVCNCSCKPVDEEEIEEEDSGGGGGGSKKSSGRSKGSSDGVDKKKLKKHLKKAKKQTKRHDKTVNKWKKSAKKNKRTKAQQKAAEKKAGFFGWGILGLAVKKQPPVQRRRIVKRFMPKPIVTTRTRPYNSMVVTAF